ncbi:pentapeptide repeat-containing protein [Microcystis aeruginosa]|jgi:uncharacterized protein YjbI with pentapeptide repeats|uniref:pentapeptide repeat-containing protein n=1 Tax=Microcystis aeruginosa TaxID=1126 RepID=UPI000261C826|nr:pentapeptide repeat-containing protein [Microcystis aeruginosa]CCI08287.1 exported hypothetical protein [Microcystis aeruginosa PCC 7941]
MKFALLFSIAVLSCVSLASPSRAENPDHVKKLKQTKQCPGCDLSGADLSGLNLRQANLQGADLSGSNLSRSDLTKANLSNAILTGSGLYASKLALPALVGKMYLRYISQERGGGTNHKDTKDTKIDRSYCQLNLSHRT